MGGLFPELLLLGPLGMNIRNEVDHGFVTDISPVYAASTLRAVALLITVVAPQLPSAARAASRENDHAADQGPGGVQLTLSRPSKPGSPSGDIAVPGRTGRGLFSADGEGAGHAFERRLSDMGGLIRRRTFRRHGALFPAWPQGQLDGWLTKWVAAGGRSSGRGQARWD